MTCRPKTSDHVLDDCIVYEVVQSQSVRVLKLEFVVVGKETKEVQRGQHLSAIISVLYVLHERRKEVTMRKVGRKSCMEAGGGYGEGSSDSFAPQGYYVLLVVRTGQLLMNIHVRPVRITVSNVAMKSVMT